VNRRSTLAVLGWVAVALLTTLTSTWAISLLGEGLSQRVVSPMSRADLARTLASATASAEPEPSAPATEPATARVRAFTTSGGSFVAACDGGLATLRSWSPAQGYATDDVVRGPAAAASLEFESDADTGTVKVLVTCRQGFPQMTSTIERDGD
jgi:hypothetical protein